MCVIVSHFIGFVLILESNQCFLAENRFKTNKNLAHRLTAITYKLSFFSQVEILYKDRALYVYRLPVGNRTNSTL